MRSHRTGGDARVLGVASGFLLIVHLFSAGFEARQGPAWLAPEVSRSWPPLVWLPTASQAKPPSTVP